MRRSRRVTSISAWPSWRPSCFRSTWDLGSCSSPEVTERAVRAVLKATDMCALEPERAARTIVERGFTKAYDYALATMKEIPYNRWREYDPEDTVRFYSLRLREVGMLKNNPKKILADGTDWRFLTELKKELKG